MLVLTFFACFGKQVSLQSPIKSIKWQDPIVVEQASPKKEAWEAVSTVPATSLSFAKKDCRTTLVNEYMLENDMCHTVGEGKTLCKGTLSGFIVTYGIVGNKVVCRKA